MGVRLEAVEVLFQEDRVGAHVDVALAFDKSLDDAVDLRMDEGLAARDRDDGGAAFLGRGPAFFGRKALAQDIGWILDFPAARALEVAGEKRLELEDQRVSLDALELARENIAEEGQLH